MSYRIKDPDTGEFITIANGSRMFVGTTAAIDAAIARGELKYPDLYACTDDYPTGDDPDIVDGWTIYRVSGNLCIGFITQTATDGLHHNFRTSAPTGYKVVYASATVAKTADVGSHTGYCTLVSNDIDVWAIGSESTSGTFTCRIQAYLIKE